ncbi:hypothetical protein KAX17_05755 [Candidatus Bipolaricaulota bacterium]|nr:hypothetical protein [Candidatus Bipolaricaulota bacterium]
MSVPRRLYKYLPDRYVEDFVKGRLLFRNLSYFRGIERGGRGDVYEGMHVDHPDNDVTITNLSKGTVMRGDFTFVNRTRADLIYCFCLSQRLHLSLFDEFSSDRCVEIIDVSEFLHRARCAVTRLKSASDWEFLHRPVKYYEGDKASGADIKESRNLAFFKPLSLSHQDEYRLVAARTSSFQLIQEIVRADAYDFSHDVGEQPKREIRFRAGSIEDIVIVHKCARDALEPHPGLGPDNRR